MSDIMKAREVLDLVIQAEEKGLNLYKTLAKNSRNFHVREVFEELAGQEEKHLDEIRQWEDKIAPEAPVEAYPGEYSLYMKAMADESTFKCDKACELYLEKDVREGDAVQAGITFEKDFILFLHGLKKRVKAEDRAIVDTLIATEETHLQKLYALKKKIQS